MDVVDDGRGASAEELLTDFGRWLSTERAVAGETVRCYRNQARKFFAHLPTPLERSMAGLDAAGVTGYVVEHAAAAGSVWLAKAHVTALRSLLRFLHVRGWISASLIGAVPGVAGWRLASLPKGLPSAQVQALLAAHDLDTEVGLRDHAVLVVLARLGLRSAEVAALQLADVEWRAGQLVVRGKGSRIEWLPLPAEVGRARADYLTGARPRCECPSLFVPARRPFRLLTPGAVRAIMGRTCDRADQHRVGAHRRGTRWPPIFCSPGRRCPRSDRCCVTAASCPPATPPEHADPALKEQAIARTAPLGTKPGRYRPPRHAARLPRRPLIMLSGSPRNPVT